MGAPRINSDFWSNAEYVTESGCLIWMKGVNRGGYGNIANREERLTHRLAWVLTHGPIPENLKVLHSCDTPSCMNPHHLFLGTDRDNHIDALKKGRWHHAGEKKTVCPLGHPYDEENTGYSNHGTRFCKKCKSDRQKAWWKLAGRSERDEKKRLMKEQAGC